MGRAGSFSVSATNTPANHFGGSFGPNEWLVDEMYERYQQDPSSVDKAWWDFFADYTPPAQSNTSVSAGTPPIPKSSQSTVPPVVPTATQVVLTPIVTPIIPASTPPIVPPVIPTPPAANTLKPADPVLKPRHRAQSFLYARSQ